MGRFMGRPGRSFMFRLYDVSLAADANWHVVIGLSARLPHKLDHMDDKLFRFCMCARLFIHKASVDEVGPRYVVFTILRVYGIWGRDWKSLILVAPLALARPLLGIVRLQRSLFRLRFADKEGRFKLLKNGLSARLRPSVSRS